MLREAGRDRRTRITRDCWLANITGTGEGDSKLEFNETLYLIGVANKKMSSFAKWSDPVCLIFFLKDVLSPFLVPSEFLIL